jgi:NDP-sugar pyrophosphorylase family protein
VGALTLSDLPRGCAKVGVMDVKAIVMVGGRPKGSSSETIGGVPIAYLDVIGQPVLRRVLERLHKLGLSAVTLVSDAEGHAAPVARSAALDAKVNLVEATGDQYWAAVENAFEQHCDNGAEMVLAVRVGAYCEIDYEEMIQHHLDRHCRISAAVDSTGQALDIFVLSTCRRSDGAALFGSHLKQVRKDCECYVFGGYVNRLQDGHDFRRLALDAMLAKNAIRPEGEQKKPGVWVCEGARIHRKARVTAPAFIGVRARIHAAALITRGSTIERGAEVDCGTVVENSSVLPFTYIGAGLDVMHAVVGFRRLVHLVRNVEVEISDKKLVGMSAVGSVLRVAGSAAALFAFLPKQIVRGIFDKTRRGDTPELPDSLNEQPPSLENTEMRASNAIAEASEFPSNLAVARRYGDQ